MLPYVHLILSAKGLHFWGFVPSNEKSTFGISNTLNYPAFKKVLTTKSIYVNYLEQ